MAGTGQTRFVIIPAQGKSVEIPVRTEDILAAFYRAKRRGVTDLIEIRLKDGKGIISREGLPTCAVLRLLRAAGCGVAEMASQSMDTPGYLHDADGSSAWIATPYSAL